MIDGGLRPLFRERVPAHWCSVETGGTVAGVPDANYCAEGCEGWIEFKRTRATHVAFRPGQLPWIRQRVAQGGRVTVCVRRQRTGGLRKGSPLDELWLVDGWGAQPLAESGLREAPWVLGRWAGGPAGWPWGLVRGLLLRPAGVA